MKAAYDCFGPLLEHSEDSSKKGTLKNFGLKVLIRTLDPQGEGSSWAWAHVRPHEWWEIMNELIKETNDVEVGVFTYED
jgi:hypothetical protein